MRFAVSQKLSRDGAWDRKDNVEVDNAVSALQVTIDQTDPSAAEMVKLAKILEVDYVITGHVKGRTLTLTMYQGGVAGGSAVAEIPPDKESPRLAVEKVLTDLAGVSFQHIREVEADKTDPATSSGGPAGRIWHPIRGLRRRRRRRRRIRPRGGRFWGRAAMREVVRCGGGEGGRGGYGGDCARVGGGGCGQCGGELPDDACEQERGGEQRAGVRVNLDTGGGGGEIPVCGEYHSTGPTLRVFLKGFAEQNDEFVDNSTPERALESTRKEYYRARCCQEAKPAFEAVEMDFTPSSDKKDLPIRWMRVDFFVYLSAGDVFLDNVVVKKIGP